MWPDLVYTEMICMLLLTALLIFWGVALQAPLEEPASAVKTPNPSKAPWYFLGLQEMLVYFDPWMAGVVLPTIILLGLMAIPYIDFNKKGNGYYCFNDRKFAVTTFLFGFLPLWIGMIILGTFLRGPNWNMFGLYEYWDVHKLELLNNNNLSDYFWTDLLRQPLPRPTADDSILASTAIILTREAPGIILVLAYLLLLPPLMAATVFRSFFAKMGFLRFMVLANLALFMAALPLKMAARWAFQLKYIVAIPEWFFNI
ncbi:MAG: cytochrome C [Maioricimonas sp. JB049]